MTQFCVESEHEMQAALNGMYHYCKLWKLKVNTNKTKVVIFGAKPDRFKGKFKLGDMEIDIVAEYAYLGILFKYNGNMSPGFAKLRDQASRAMYA